MPEDEEVPEEDEDERAQVLSKPRVPARFNEDEDEDHSENGEDIEEEYVSLSAIMRIHQPHDTRGRKSTRAIWKLLMLCYLRMPENEKP